MACEYCKCPPVPLYFVGAGYPVVSVRRNSVEVIYYEQKLLKKTLIMDSKPINYCPICGRKLRGDDE